MEATSVDARAAAFLAKVTDQLVQLHQNALSLFEAVPLATRTVPVDDNSHKTVGETYLEPNPEQRAAATAISNELYEWADLVLVFIERHPSEHVRHFSEAVALFATYTSFQRVGGGISEELWRYLFRKESQAVVSFITTLLHQLSDAFTILTSRGARRYSEFTLRIRREASGTYRAEAYCAQGEADQVFVMPYDERETETFVLRYCRPRSTTVRGWVPPTMRPFAQFGQALYDALWSGEIRDLFQRARQHAASRDEGLRITLRLGAAPELGDIPWEFLFDGRDFLCLSQLTPVTRYIDAGVPVPSLTTTFPLRVLITASNPSGLPKIDIDAERRRLSRSLAPLVALGMLRVDWSQDGQLRTLQRMLRTAELSGNPYHIWHYIGHGRLDEAQGSVLLFEDGEGRATCTSGFELATMFGAYPSLKLSILNACEAARSGRAEGLPGAATALVERGMAAVIAMQFEISQETAVLFSEEFYTALVDGAPIDSALTEARRSIFFAESTFEWATPVLFMRSAHGILFDFADPPATLIKPGTT